MYRRAFVVGLLSGLAAPLAGEGQAPARATRVGYLSSGGVSRVGNTGVDVVLEELRRFGWVEGQNLAFEYRGAGGRSERLPALAAELVRLQMDVIVGDLTAVRAAKEETSTIPIVSIGGDLLTAGLVASLARPGGNVTGVSFQDAEGGGKRLQVLKEAVPKCPTWPSSGIRSTPPREVNGAPRRRSPGPWG